MKKKFNIYCTIILVAIALSVIVPFANTVYFASRGILPVMEEVVDDVKKGVPENEIKMDLPEEINTITLVPKYYNQVFNDSILNKKSGKFERIQAYDVAIGGDHIAENTDKYTIPGEVCSTISEVLKLIAFILFIKIILAVNKGKLFEKRTEGLLKKCGWIYISSFLLQWIYTGCMYLYLNSIYDFELYSVDIVEYPETITLIVGVSMLIIQQIMIMGRNMKEEQELTI